MFGSGFAAVFCEATSGANFQAAKCAAEGKDDEAETAEEKCDPDDDANQGHLLGHVGRSAQLTARSRSPRYRGRIGTGLPFASLSATASSLVPAGFSGSSAETKRPILGVAQAAGALGRMFAHDLRERPRLGAGLDLLVGPLRRMLATAGSSAAPKRSAPA